MSESCDRCSASCEHIDECIGEGIGFERIRRITGYITGNVNTWNNAKKEELKDRVTHGE